MRMHFAGVISVIRRALIGLAFVMAPQIVVAAELHSAAQAGDLAALTALIEGGAHIDETDGENETALHKAAKGNHAAAVRLLLKAGADPYIRGNSAFGSTGTPLHAAARLGQVEALRALLDAGIDPNLQDAGSGPPLHHAVLYNRDEAVKLLRSYGAGPVSANSIKGLIAEADPQAGKEAANSCVFCHLMQAEEDDRPTSGPSLWNILGRPKAAEAGFDYSAALLAVGGSWSYDDLNSYIANPRGYAPGLRMDEVHGIGPAERRAALIRYLRDLSDAPMALPE